ncbi:MAG: type II toxin-antitoxin system Phd/YefM family antitoxin [Hyphomicrobiales bacterium]|nr:type II toxin-antitoxin system Phd/YefM family antitoxin [Hyphomicrobiales bacterium]
MAMKTWSLTEARTNMSNVFDEALKHGPQRIERRDSEPVVMVAESDWNRLIAEYPTMADLILNAPFNEDDLPERRPARAITRDFF